MIFPAVTEYDYVVQVNGTEMRGKLLIGAGDIDRDPLCRPSQTMTKDQDHVVADVSVQRGPLCQQKSQQIMMKYLCQDHTSH